MILFKNKKVLCLIGILSLIAVSFFYLKTVSQRETAAAFSPYYEGNIGNQQVSICINLLMMKGKKM